MCVWEHIAVLFYTHQVHHVGCHDGIETIFHVLSACPILAVTDYLNRHNAVASILYQSICSSFKFPIHCEKPRLYHPESVVEGNGVRHQDRQYHLSKKTWYGCSGLPSENWKCSYSSRCKYCFWRKREGHKISATKNTAWELVECYVYYCPCCNWSTGLVYIKFATIVKVTAWKISH